MINVSVKWISAASSVKWVVLIFIIAMGLRVSLGLFNREANDNHVDVVNFILAKHQLPEKNDCWSCYQPKFYYVFCAGIIKTLNIEDLYLRIIVMQLVNVVLSFFILLIFWKFIDRQPLTAVKKLIAFAFFAFNPCLTGINIQGTNDTAAIFFGVWAVYEAFLFFREMNFTRLIFLTVALIGGALCKASVLVLIVLTCGSFAAIMLFDPDSSKRRRAFKFLIVLVIGIGAIVPYSGGYYNNYKKYNSLSLSTWEKDKPPFFFEKTWVVRSGLRSMFEGYFTFRYFDMIRQPYINNEWNNYPLHRTSLWSQLYGRTMFMHFDQWPPGWQSQSPFIVNTGRVLIILGIIPLLLFLTGIFLSSGRLILELKEKNMSYYAQPLNYLFLLITLLYLAASMFYCYNYRDFSSMKSIYIFPGMLAFIKMFSDGYNFYNGYKISRAINLSLIAIAVFSIVDIGFLVYSLH